MHSLDDIAIEILSLEALATQSPDKSNWSGKSKTNGETGRRKRKTHRTRKKKKEIGKRIAKKQSSVHSMHASVACLYLNQFFRRIWSMYLYSRSHFPLSLREWPSQQIQINTEREKIRPEKQVNGSGFFPVHGKPNKKSMWSKYSIIECITETKVVNNRKSQ